MQATYEEIAGWIDRLKEEELPIIVEGKKDRAALNRLGLKNILILDCPLYEAVEKILAGLPEGRKSKSVILLTDLDPEGRKLYSRLKQDLGERGVAADDRFREFLFAETKLRQIEGIDTYMEKLKLKKQLRRKV